MGFLMNLPAVVLISLILISVELIIAGSVAADAHNLIKPRAVASPKVNLTLYYESLCPGSADFVVNDLAKAARTPDIQQIINLRFVPLGNADFNSSTKAILCQHGENECYLNSIHACAIESWPDMETHFEFIYCMAAGVTQYDLGSKETGWRECCKQLKLDPSLLSRCYESGLSTKLELQYREETERLRPPKDFVPWVVVDGRPLGDDFPNFMHYICLDYKGPTPPKACEKIPHQLEETTSYLLSHDSTTKTCKYY